jgi:thiamine-phosphate pyrophosphorylase
VPDKINLYLDFQFDGGSTAEAAGVFSAAIGAAPIASVLIRGANLLGPTLKALITLAQKHGIAALVEASDGDAPMFGADGIHLGWSPDIVSKFKALRRERPGIIVGADAGRSRHEAMELGESGADYVAFGIPPHVEDRAKAADRQLDLIGWWAELFEVPCVAFDVPDAGSAHALAAAGADFVSLRMSSKTSENDAVARTREFSEALRLPEPAK